MTFMAAPSDDSLTIRARSRRRTNDTKVFVPVVDLLVTLEVRCVPERRSSSRQNCRAHPRHQFAMSTSPSGRKVSDCAEC